MKRRWNLWLWAGFLLVMAGAFSYVPLFALYPVTRDFPWANLLLFLAGVIGLSVGLFRAFGQSQQYRGKVCGPILTALSVVVIAFFAYGILYHARQLPVAAAAPPVGQKAPDFTLPDQNGKPTTLANLLSAPLEDAAG